MKTERVLFRIFGTGTIREYPLTWKEQLRILQKKSVKGWKGRWRGAVFLKYRGGRVYICFVSEEGMGEGMWVENIYGLLKAMEDWKEPVDRSTHPEKKTAG